MSIPTKDYVAAIESSGYALTGKETRNNLIFIYATLLHKGVSMSPPVMPVRATLTYTVRWSEEDGEWVALSDAWPSLSWLDSDPAKALDGLIKVIAECETDIESEGKEVST